MAIQSSVLVMASLLFAANALSGLRAKNDSKGPPRLRGIHVPRHWWQRDRTCHARVMREKCKLERDACDVETPHRRGCRLTTCFETCRAHLGCSRNAKSSSMACHEKCVGNKPSPSETALMGCVIRNTQWMKNVVAVNLAKAKTPMCPNARFPCKDRCEVMHNSCQSQLSACDAGTPSKHCALTECFKACGCSHGSNSTAMACHDKCLMKHNAPSDIPLKQCVYKNTKWIQAMVKKQAAAAQAAAAR